MITPRRNPDLKRSRSIGPSTRSRRTMRGGAPGCAAALVVFLILALTTPHEAAAQAPIGNLIVTITAPTSGSTVLGTITVTADVIAGGTLAVASVQFKLDGANLGQEDNS